MLKTGSVFSVLLSPQEPKRHLWVVILAVDKEDNAVCVNITSSTKDHFLEICSAEYPLLTQDISYANFPQARIENITKLETKIRPPLGKKCPDVSASLLKQLQEGALKSKFTPQNIKEFLKKHLKIIRKAK